MEKYADYNLRGKLFHDVEVLNTKDRAESFPGTLITSILHYGGLFAGILYSVVMFYYLSFFMLPEAQWPFLMATSSFAVMFIIPTIKGAYYTLKDNAVFIPERVAEQLSGIETDCIKIVSTGVPGAWVVEYPNEGHPPHLVAMSSKEIRRFRKKAKRTHVPIAEATPQKRFWQRLSSEVEFNRLTVRRTVSGKPHGHQPVRTFRVVETGREVLLIENKKD